MNKVVPMQQISEETESTSDSDTLCENGNGSDEETISRPTLKSKISTLSNDSVSSGQLKSTRNANPKPRVRFGVRRRRSSFEKVLKDREKTGSDNIPSRRTASCRSILQCEREHDEVKQNGSQTPFIKLPDGDCGDEKKLKLLRYVCDVTNSDDMDASIDLGQVRSMIQSGVPVNARDIHGQTALHEVTRSWSVEVAKVLVEEGADINIADNLGRTPLHVAASVDFNVMLKFLLENRADVDARTIGESQTPLHFAARNEAVSCVKTLLIFNAEIDARDFKRRTPLQVAAEHDSAEAAEVLLNKGASAMVKDDTGLSVLVLFILKMPSVALRALDQYHIIDRTHRKQYLYIKSIENLDQSQGSSTAVPSPLQAVVETDCYELVTHPLFQRLIEIKWHYLGRRGAWLDIVPNALLAILYTVLGVTFPDKVSEYYRPLVSKWWRVLLEMIVLSLLINEVRKEILELRSSKAQYTKWIEWRSREVKRDLEYCHPRCPQEKAFVERQVETAKKQRKTTYFQDVWNYLDWVAYSMMMAVFILHFATLADESDDDLNLFVIQFMSCTLIVMWIRMLKFARPFPAQGPFVVILDHIIVDTFRWSFIFLMIYIPYGAAFWMNFGGRTAKPVDGYKTLSELMFTMLRYPIVDSNDYETLLKDPHSTMPRLLGGTYLVIGALILMNMFIALMSHTFQRVYDNATATAAMQRARLIQGIEPHPLINPDVEYRKFINSQCCPEQRDYLVIVTEQEDQNRKQEEKISRLHSIINLRLGGKKFGKLDKSEFEIALEDIDSLKASIMKMNFSLKELSDRLEQVAESVHQDVGALGSSQAQIITQLKADQERDIRELRGDLNAKTESLKHFQAEKIDTLTALHAESVGELKVVHAIGQGELTLLHSQNTEDLKILQAEGVQEIKLQQALGFADLKLTQVQCSEELKPSPLQGNQEKNKRSTGQELKPYQLQMVEDLRLAKEQKFRDLKFSQEQDFNEMNLFQETTFENLKATNTQEFAQVYQSGHVRSSTKETGSRTEVEEERLPKEWINPPSDGNGLLQRVAAARDTQAKFIHTLKSSQAKKVSELRRLQASNLERFRQTQNENLIQIKQPEDLTSLGAKYEKLDKERERILSEERFIGGLAKVYAAPKGKLGGRAQRRDRKVSRAWNQKQLERRQTISNPDEEERSGSETLSAHSDGQKDRPAQAGHQGPVSGTERDTQESPNFARNGSIALEEVSTGSLSTSPETATDCENKNSKNNRLPMEKTVEDSSDLAAAKSRVDVSVDSLPQLESRPSDEGCKTELDPNHSSTHSDGPEGDDGDLLPSNSMGAQDVGENEIAKQENSCHLPPIAAAGDKGKEELTTPENGAKTAEQKDPPHANDRGVLPPIFSVKKRDTADKPGNEIENVRGIKLAKQSEGLILDNEKNTGSREHSGNEQSSIISTLPSLKSQPILRETELSSADCIEVKTGGKTGANLKMEAEKNEPGRDEVNGRRQSIRADQPDDKSNPNTSTDSLVFVNETNSSGTASSSDHHGEVSPQDLKSEDQEVEEFKPGTEGQEKRMSRKPKRRDSKGVPCGNHDAERGAKGTVRTDSDHIASLMKLYGGMKVDGKKKRQSKGKNLDKKPED